jgi:hypothetical protein
MQPLEAILANVLGCRQVGSHTNQTLTDPPALHVMLINLGGRTAQRCGLTA